MKEIQHMSSVGNQQGLRSTVVKYLKYWPLFLLILVLGITTAFLYLRYLAKDSYEVQAKILINDKDSGQSLGKIDNFNNLGLIKTAHSIDDQIGILASTGVMEDVIRESNYNISYFLEGSIKDVEVYGEEVPITIVADETSENLLVDTKIMIKFDGNDLFQLIVEENENQISIEGQFGDLLQSEIGTFTVMKKPDVSLKILNKPLFFKITSRDAYVDYLIKNLSVTPDNKTGSLLTLNFISGHKEKGEDILNSIIQTYIKKTISYENELAENTIKMIDERLKVLSGEIEDVEKTVVDFKTQEGVTDIARNADVFIQQSNDYKSRVADYQTQIRVMEQMQTALTLGDTEMSIGGAINDPALADLVSKYNATLIEKQNLERSANSSNPAIADYNETLKSLRASISSNVNSLKNSYTIARGNLLANASRFDARIAKVPQMEKQLLDISREKSTKEGLYLYLLQKREEEVLSLAAPVSSTRIVSLPKAGMFPVSPNKKLTYLMGILLGFVIPIALLQIKEALNNKVQSAAEVRSTITAPVVGEIYKSKNKGIIIKDSQSNVSPIAEVFRLLEFNLDYLNKEAENKVILVTSSIKGEGKTFIASNLAATMAYNGEKVVALSFDLRQPKLMERFGIKAISGISDYILKKGLAVDEIIVKHPTIDDLDVIGPGVSMFQIGRLLLSKRIKELITELKTRYDRIIIDTAPIGIISDAYALNPYVDSTIYVVRAGVTPKDQLRNIEETFRNNKLANTMVLVNDTEPLGNYAYGYPSK